MSMRFVTEIASKSQMYSCTNVQLYVWTESRSWDHVCERDIVRTMSGIIPLSAQLFFYYLEKQ